MNKYVMGANTDVDADKRGKKGKEKSSKQSVAAKSTKKYINGCRNDGQIKEGKVKRKEREEKSRKGKK